MSLQPQAIPPIPDLTATVARRAFRKGNLYMQMRDVLGTFYTDDQFTDLYPADGQPAYAPWRLALVSVMQFAENLTDEGFDFSVLSEFRQRLLEHEAGERMLNTMLRPHFHVACQRRRFECFQQLLRYVFTPRRGTGRRHKLDEVTLRSRERSIADNKN